MCVCVCVCVVIVVALSHRGHSSKVEPNGI